MPVPNDLTPEEEAEFTAQGMPSPGPGSEPTGEPSPEPVIEEPAHGDRQPRGPDGKFAPKAAEAPAAPVADPSVAPVADPSAAPVADPNAPPPGFVPHQALHQERQERQRLAQQMATLQARTNVLLQARQQPEAAPAGPPDMQQDPVAYLQWLENRVTTFEQQRQQENEYRQVDAGVNQDEEAFKTYTPDYEQASQHYVESRARELLAVGYAPQQVQQMMLDETRQMANMAWQRGGSVAQMIYASAQARGYRPGAMPAPQPAPQQRPTPPVPAPAPTAGLTPATAVAAAKTGMQATRTLAGGAAAPAVALNAEAILSMSDEEFEQHIKLGSKGANERFAALMG